MDVQHLEAVRPKRPDVLYEFGPYVVDVSKSVLLREGEVVPVGLKAFEVLLVLIQHHGQVVMKDELLSHVWPDTVVEENNLARTISALRKALGESLGTPQFIATIPGRGYRFVAEVKEVEQVSEPAHLTWQPHSNGHSITSDLNTPSIPVSRSRNIQKYSFGRISMNVE